MIKYECLVVNYFGKTFSVYKNLTFAVVQMTFAPLSVIFRLATSKIQAAKIVSFQVTLDCRAAEFIK